MILDATIEDGKRLDVVGNTVRHLLKLDGYVPKENHYAEVIRGDHTHESIASMMRALEIATAYHSEYRVSDEAAEAIQAAREFTEDPDKKLEDLGTDELQEAWTESSAEMAELCERLEGILFELQGKVGIDLYEARFNESRLAWYVIDPEYRKFTDLVGELEAMVEDWEEVWGEIEEGQEEREKAKLQAAVDELADDVKFRSFKTQAEQIAYAINTVPGLNEIEHSEASKLIKALITRLKVEGK